MPPKKDAFADLFLSAAGASQSLSRSSLNILASQDQKPKSLATQWSNIDILSPNVASPQGSSSNTPRPSAAEFDPFSIFDSKASPSPSVSISVDKDNSQIKPNVQANVQSNAHATSRPNAGMSLLDDEFTDAFVSPQAEPLETPQSDLPRPSSRPVAPTPERANIAAPIRSQSAQAMDERDTVLAELVDIGFPIDIANRAIDEVGPDLQTCVNHIMSRGQSRSSSVLLRNGRNGRNDDFNRSERQLANSPDLGGSFQDISSDILKKASWLFDKSKKTVIKNINHLQNTYPRDAHNSMPTWMKNQSKYKDGALERKRNGETYEDYGEDEENIDAEEIQRIMRQQKEREVERQRERLESMGKPSSGRSSRGSEKDSQRPPDVHIHAALGRNSPAVAPRMPVRPSLTPANRSSRARQQSSPLVKDTSNVPIPTALQPPKAAAQKVPEPEVDLLGLGGGGSLSRAERFKQDSGQGQTYVSPSRRRPGKVSKPRNATAEALNAFQQSDFETFKGKATTSFTQGDYGDALNAYTRCLESLPPKHELRIVIFSNLAITQINLGNYKAAKQQCELGIELVGDNIDDSDWTINDKVIKYWYIRLLTRKAESLQMLENFPESLQCYVELVTKYGVTDKKVMDAKRRVGNIVNLPKPAPKPRKPASPSPVPSGPVANNEVVEKIRQKHQQERAQDEMRFKLHDKVHDRITAWTDGKDGNLRSLLMSLDEVIPARLGFPFLQKKITISDLMLTKKVKINYMKVISSIHPDKLSKFGLEDQMICQAVFVALNKAWDTFKEQNGLN